MRNFQIIFKLQKWTPQSNNLFVLSLVRPEIYELQVNFISINTQHYTCDCYEVSKLGLEAFLRLIARIEE